MFIRIFVTVHSLKSIHPYGRTSLEIRNWKFMLSYFCTVDKRIQLWTKFFNYYFEPFCSTCQNTELVT